VGSADGDEDAGFADLQTTEAVNDGYAMDGELFMQSTADFFHFGEGHGFVGFVVKIESGTAMRLVAHEAVESDDGTVLICADILDDGDRVDG